MYMRILHNFHVIVDTYFPMMNDIVLVNLCQNVSAAILLTWIAIFEVLVLVLFFNLHMELAKQEKRGVTQNVFWQWTK